MDWITTIFNEALYRPLLNVLFLFYQYIPGHDMGVAVILLTLLIRFIFYPLGAQAIKSQKKTAELQPKLKEIQERHKDNKEAQTKAIMDLYKEHNFNPLSGCLPLLVQFPFVIALYQVFLHGLTTDVSSKFYSFMPHINQANVMFLGIINLSQANIVLAILAGIAQFLQFKTMPQQPKKKGQSDLAQALNSQMGYIFPIVMVAICWKIPAAVTLYLIVTTVFSIVQQLIIYKKPKTN